MSTEGDISINLRLENGEFTATVANSGKLLRELRTELNRTADASAKTERHFNSFSGHFKSFMMTVAATRFALMDINQVFLALPVSVAKTAGEFERLMKLMEGLSKASTEAQKASEAMKSMSYVIDMAKRSPFEVKALADAFVKLKSGGIDPMNGSMNALVNSVAKFGGDSQTLHRASIAIQQMAGKGVISMEELRQQLGEAVPNAMELMARGMGLSMAELTEKVSKGTVEARSALAKMFIEMEIDAHGAAQAMMDTIPGALAELKTSWQLFQKEVAEGGFANEIKSQLRELSSYLNSKDGQNFARNIGESLVSATKALIGFKDVLSENIELIKTLGILLVSAFGGAKLRAAFEGSKKMWEEQRKIAAAAADERNKAFTQEIDQYRVRAQEVRTDIANKKAIITADREAFRAKIAADNERLRSEVEANRKIASDRLAHYRELQNQALAAERESQAAAARANQMRAGVDAGGYVFRDKTGASRNDSMARQYAETAAEMRRLAAEHLNVAQAAQRDNVAKEALIASSARMKFALTDEHRAILSGVSHQAQYVRAIEGVIAAKQKAHKAATVAGSAVIGFGKSLLSMVGWGIAVQGAFWAIGELWDMLASKTERATRAQERYQRIKRGEGTTDDLKDQQKELDDAKLERSNRQFAIDRARRAGNEKLASSLEQKLPQLDAKVAGLQAKVDKVRGDIHSGEVERDAAAITARVQKVAEDAIYETASYKALERANSDLTKAQSGGSKAAIDSARKAQSVAKIAWLKDSAALYERTAKAEAARIAKSGEFLKDAVKKANRDIFGDDGLVASRRANVDQAVAPNKFIGGKDSDKPPKQTAGQKLLDGLREKAAALNAELNKEGTGTIAKLLEDAKNKLNAKQIDEGTFAKAKRIIEQMGEAKEALKIDDDISSVSDRIASATAGIDSQIEGSTSTIGKLKLAVDELRNTPYLSEEQVNDLLRLDSALANLQNRQDTLDAQKAQSSADGLVKTMKGQIGDFRASLLTGTDALKAAFVNDTEQMKLGIEKVISTHKFTEEQLRVIWGQFYDWKTAREQKLARDSETPIQQLARQWGDTTKQMQSASANWLEGAADMFVKFAQTGKLEFASLARSILADIGRIMIKKAIANIVGMATGMPMFANGGIMTELGAASLKKYANGGIANSPQLALFGEGSMPEAYVPLPDGRSIPVTLTLPNAAGPTGTGDVYINITVNNDGSEVDSGKGDKKDAYTGMADRIKTVVREELVTQKRPGGILYK